MEHRIFTATYQFTPMIILKCLMFLAKRWACVQLFNTEVF